MKRAIYVLLAAGSAALAGEAEPSGETPVPPADSAPDPMNLEILPDGGIRLPNGRIIARGLVRIRPGTCYFIRNMGLLQAPQPELGEAPPPAAAADDAQAPELDRRAQLLQRYRERSLDLPRWSFARGPDCTNSAVLMPIPADSLQILVPEPAGEPPPPPVAPVSPVER